MPLKRKIIKVGKTSRAVILPAEWLTWCEDRAKHPLTHVYIGSNNHGGLIIEASET